MFRAPHHRSGTSRPAFGRRPAVGPALVLALGAATLTFGASGTVGAQPVDEPVETAETPPADALPVDVSGTVTLVKPALTPVADARYADTRATGVTIDGQYEADGPVAAGAEYEVTIAGRGAVPPSAVGVIANVTAVGPAAAGYFTVYDCDPPLPNASALNYTTGVDVANEIVIALSAAGSMCVYSSAASDLLIDVVGYVSATDSIKTATPARFGETRVGATTFDGLYEGLGRTSPGSTTKIGVEGRGIVPPSVNAVIVNVGVVDPDTDSFVTVYSCFPAVPLASSINHTAGVDRANELIVKPDANGDICIYTDQAVDLIVDVVGYVETGSDLVSIANRRFVETRDGATTFDGVNQGGGKLADGSTTTVQIAGRGTVPPDAVAAIVNVAAVDPDAPGFFTVDSCNTPRPNASSLNYTTGVNGANELIASLDATGKLCIYTSASTHVLVDVVGYLQPNADLSITKSDDIDPIAAGTDLTYTVEVTNDGPDPATDVVVTDTLPAGVTLVSTSGCAEDPAGTPTCTLGDLAPGATASYTATVTVDLTTAGTITNTATVTSATGDPDPSDNSAAEDTDVFQVGTIEIVKATDPAGGTGFGFTGDIGMANVFTLDDGETKTFASVEVGTYSVTEDDPTGAGYNLSALDCVDTDAGGTASTGDIPTRTATIVLDPNETVTCTFTNTNRGAIIVEKQTLPDGDPQTFGFTGDAAGTIGDGGTLTVADLVPGTYTSTETLPAGWDLTDITCDDTDSSGDTGTATATFEVAAGEVVRCTFTNTKRGTVTIVKDADPDSAQDFSFTAVGGLVPASFDLDDDADATLSNTQTFTDVPPGPYSVTEADPTPGFDLTGLTCVDSDAGGLASTTGLVSRTATINLDPGETVTCTYTNTERGTITIVKDADPNGPTDFAFTDDIAAPNAFTLDDDADATLSNTETFTDVVPGSYTVAETDPTPGFDLTSLVCVDSDAGGTASTGSTATRTATINVDPGETVTCTFGNTRRGTISIVKSTDPTGGTGFGFTDDIPGSGSFTLDDAQTETILDVPAGSYTVTEDDPAPGYVLTGLTCVDTDAGGTASTGNSITRAATINLDPGETVTCTYTNSQSGTITIVKDADPNGPTDFAFTDDIAAPNAFTLDDDADATYSNTTTFTAVNPGTYTVTEDDPTPGFDLTGLVCVDSDAGGTASTGSTVTRAATINLDPGETVTCTYTNTERGTITIIKDADPNGPTDFAFTDDIASPNAFSLDDDADGTLSNTETFTDVLPGSYTVTEADPTPGFDLTGLVCVDSDAGGTASTGSTVTRAATINLDPGETVTCTYTNTERGTINITKATDPAGATGFGFTDDIPGSASFTLDDTQTETIANVVPGSYTVTEDDPTPGFDLTGLVCVDSDAGGTASTGSTVTRAATINLDPGETVTCTYTNTERGTITIIKDADPNGPTDFAFTDDIASPNAFSLDDDADGTLSNTETFTDVLPGSYTVTEADPTPGFDLTGLVCVDSDAGGTASTGSTVTRAATINLDPGETVTCTYTNTERGTINITKATDPAGATGFGFTDDIPGSASFTLDDTQTETIANVVPGSYTVTEDDPTPGFDLTGLVCVDSDAGGTASTGSTVTRAATINLDPGETVTCTYTNTERGTITIIKEIDPDDPQDFSFTTTGGLSPATFDLDDDSDPTLPKSTTYANVVPGTYTVTEADPIPAILIDLVCVDTDTGGTDSTVDVPTRVATIQLDPGETVTCTYTNSFNTPPVLADVEGAALAYTEDDPAAQITGTITVADVTDTNLQSAVVQITGNYQNGQDVLAATGLPAGITAGAFDTALGSITLTGSATLADYQTALRAVTYRNTSNDPSTSTRTVTFTANDGIADSNTQTRDITVTPVNDAPTATNLTQTKTYTEGDTTVALDDIVVSDIDTSPAQTITATLTLANTATGVLTAASGNGETYTAGTGVWTVTGTITAVNSALAATSFTPATNNDVDTTITTHVEDQDSAGPADGTITLDVTPVNDAPTATNLTQTKTYTEGDATVALDDIVVSDIDTSPAQTITATLTLANTATGVLTAASGNGETYTAGTGVWTVTGTITAVNSALAATSFTPATNNDVDTTITTHVEDQDSAGPADGTITLDVTPVNDPPVIVADSYTTIGNVQLRVDANPGGAVTTPGTPYIEAVPNQPLANDSDIDSTLTAGTVTVAPTKGAVALNSDGTFLYTPNAGATGADSFTFKVLEDAVDNGATETVNITIGGAVWFVKNNQAAGGLGRSNDPFDTLAEAQTASSAGHTIFVYAGTGTTTGQTAGIALKDNQQLIGESAGLTVVDPNNAGQSLVIPAVPASRPKIANTVAASNGIDLAANNLVRGLDIISATETGISMVRTGGTTTAKIIDVGVSNTVEEGILFDLSGTATVTALVQGDATGTTKCRFDTIGSQGVDGVAVGSSSLNLTIDGCVFTDTDAADGAIKVNPDGTANANATIKNNVFGPVAPAGPEVFLKNDSQGILDVTVDNNTAVLAHVGRKIEVIHDDDGSGPGGIANGTTRLDIKNNNLGGGGSAFEAIFVDARETTGVNTDIDVSATITNNSVAAPTGGFGDFFGSNAIFLDSRAFSTTCADITSNTATGGPFGAAAIAVEQLNSAVMQLEGLSGGAAAFLAAQNPASTVPIGATGGAITASVGACPAPAATPLP